MKVHVNMDLCLMHGQCVIAAPEIFSFDDDGGLVWVNEISDAQIADAEAASDACPEQAIILG